MEFFGHVERDVQRSVILFVLYRFTSRLYFHLPVLFLLFDEVQMGLHATIVLLVVYGLVTTITANASTLLLPHFRQKNVVALGEALKAAGVALVIYGTSIGGTSFWIALAGQIVGGVGFSIAVSTDSSLLRSVLGPTGNESFTQIQGRTQSIMFVATLIAGSSGGFLYAYEAHWPFYASVAASLLATLLISLVREDAATADPIAHAQKDRFKPEPTQQFWMKFYAVSRAYTLAPFMAFLPFFFISLQVEPSLFGFVLGAFTVSAFLAALYGNDVLKRFGAVFLLCVTVGAMLSSLLLLGFSDWFAYRGIDYFVVGVVSIVLFGFGAGGVRPVTMANLNLGKLEPRQRTTLLSNMERDFGITNGLLLLFGGYLLGAYGFHAMMLALGIVYVLLMGALIVWKYSGMSFQAES